MLIGPAQEKSKGYASSRKSSLLAMTRVHRSGGRAHMEGAFFFFLLLPVVYTAYTRIGHGTLLRLGPRPSPFLPWAKAGPVANDTVIESEPPTTALSAATTGASNTTRTEKRGTRASSPSTSTTPAMTRQAMPSRSSTWASSTTPGSRYILMARSKQQT
jgi:hypothetical protein